MSVGASRHESSVSHFRLTLLTGCRQMAGDPLVGPAAGPALHRTPGDSLASGAVLPCRRAALAARRLALVVAGAMGHEQACVGGGHARSGDADAAGGAPCGHASPPRAGRVGRAVRLGRRIRQGRQRRGQVDPALCVSDLFQPSALLPGAGRGATPHRLAKPWGDRCERRSSGQRSAFNVRQIDPGTGHRFRVWLRD